MFNALNEREMGQYPLSVATSLALESATGIHPEVQHKEIPIKQIRLFWVNVRTLFRNMMGSLSKDDQGGVVAEELAKAILEEMDQIVAIVKEHSGSLTKVVFYVSDYASLEVRYRKAVPRMDNTPKQKEYTAIQTQTIGFIQKWYDKERAPYELKFFRLKLENSDKNMKAMILTHYAFDLCSRREFEDLVLLESHTGAVKKYAQWYTKYTGGKELSMIPFREDFLQVFGDSETFRPMDIKLRKDLIEVATKYGWTPVTTRDKIVFSIEQIKNPYARDILKDILV